MPAPDQIAESGLEVQLDRYLRHLVVERGLSVNTVAAYKRDLSGYLAFLRTRAVVEAPAIGTDDVSAYVASLRTRETGALTASSTARMLSSVRGFHRYLHDEGIVDTDVAAESKPPRLPSRLPKAISIEQMAAVLDAARGETPQALRDTALLELLYATGARISEAVDLNVDDVIDANVADGEVVRLFGKG